MPGFQQKTNNSYEQKYKLKRWKKCLISEEMKIEMCVSFIKVVKQILKRNMLARLQGTGRQIAKMDCFIGITCPHLVKLFTQQTLNLG